MTERSNSHFIHRIDYSMRERLVGIFILLGVILLFAQLFVSSQLLDLFAAKRSYFINLSNPSGLAVDSKVRVSGLDVGWVEQVNLTDQNIFSIELTVYEEYNALIRQDSRASINKPSLVGDSVVDISPGNIELQELEDGAELLTEAGLTVDDVMLRLTPLLEQAEAGVAQLSKVLASLPSDSVPNILSDLEDTFSNFQQLSELLNDNNGSIANLLLGNEFSTSVQETVDSSNRLIEETQLAIQSIDNKLDNSLQQLPAIMSDIEQLVANLSEASTELPELVNDTDVLIDESNEVVDSVGKTWPLSSFIEPDPNTSQPIDAIPAN